MPAGVGTPLNKEEGTKLYYGVDTLDWKIVSDYTGMDFNQLSLLDCVTFKLLFRDGYIYKLEETEEGREYLEQCWTLKQTNPDTSKLMDKFGGDKK